MFLWNRYALMTALVAGDCGIGIRRSCRRREAERDQVLDLRHACQPTGFGRLQGRESLFRLLRLPRSLQGEHQEVRGQG